MTENKMNIMGMFRTRQMILQSKLNILLEHPVTKGDHCEGAWIDFFRSFLPSRYAVDKGFIFDSAGRVSDQIDIIIYDSIYSPLIFGTDAGEKFITAESVYAIFESKQKIDKYSLEYTSKKIASVTQLKRTRREYLVGGDVKEPRDLTPILGGILAIDSVNLNTIRKHLITYKNIDIGCAIQKTSFVRYRNDEGDLTDLQFSIQEESILAFFYIVLDKLYRLGTVAGIDIKAYADATVDSIELSSKPIGEEK